MENKHLIVLLSDFGLSDPYVGIMKGVILNIAPDSLLIDLTHQIQPQNILQASFLLSSHFRQFPRGTIFICVVDPGVGTKREPVLVSAFGAFFIGPDNGIFGFLNEDPRRRITRLKNKKYFITPVSNTFHGRDIFAPVAAHLSVKGPGIIPDLGTEQARLLDITGRLPNIKDNYIEGRVAHTDRFGNLISNIHHSYITSLAPDSSNCTIRFKGEVLPLVKTFAEAPDGTPCTVIGSTSHLEIFIKNQSAEKTLKSSIGEKIHVIKHHE